MMTCGLYVTYKHALFSAINSKNVQVKPVPYTIRGGGALKAPPPPTIFCPHVFNIGATILCVGDFSQKIEHRVAKKDF